MKKSSLNLTLALQRFNKAINYLILLLQLVENRIALKKICLVIVTRTYL